MRSFATLLLLLVVIGVATCSDDDQSRPIPDGIDLTRTPGDAATPPEGVLHMEPLPGDGTGQYRYTRQLAYVDPEGGVWVVDADGGNRRRVMDGCTGIGSPKSGALTGGLRWSPTGEWLACWNEDLSVRVVRLDSGVSGQPFGPGECEGGLVYGPSFPPGARGVACISGNSIAIRDPQGTTLQSITTIRPTAAWLPNGGVISSAEGVGRGAWEIYDAQAVRIVRLDDAFVGDPNAFAFSPDGAMVAYPGGDGLTLVDVETGAKRIVETSALGGPSLRGGADLQWALSGTALVMTGYPAFGIIDAQTGDVRVALEQTVTGGSVSPDGRYLVGLSGDAVAVANLEDGTVRTISGFDWEPQGIGPGLHYAWAGDSASVCWLDLAGGEPYCAALDTLEAQPLIPDLQWREDELGYGDYDIVFGAVAPDGSHVAYTVPGPADADSPQELRIASHDGSGEVVVGSALGAYPAAWRPDGIWRQ